MLFTGLDADVILGENHILITWKSLSKRLSNENKAKEELVRIKNMQQVLLVLPKNGDEIGSLQLISSAPNFYVKSNAYDADHEIKFGRRSVVYVLNFSFEFQFEYNYLSKVLDSKLLSNQTELGKITSF